MKGKHENKNELNMLTMDQLINVQFFIDTTIGN